MTADETNQWILARFGLTAGRRLPIEIPDINRDGMAAMFAELGFAVGAEVGVERGQYSKVLCQSIPNLHLFCVDSWRHYRGYRDFVNDTRLEGFYEETKARLAGYNVTFLRQFSMDAVKTIPDGVLDFVYIDANHEFRYVTDDIAEWSRKVRPGGIISGHDYMLYLNRQTPIHVFYVVTGWTQAYSIDPWFVAGAKEKVPGRARDRVRSWFWVQR